MMFAKTFLVVALAAFNVSALNVKFCGDKNYGKCETVDYKIKKCSKYWTSSTFRSLVLTIT